MDILQYIKHLDGKAFALILVDKPRKRPEQMFGRIGKNC